MENINELRLREKEIFPTNDVIECVLGNSYVSYERFQEMLSDLEVEQNFMWYTPHKVWCGKGEYFWTTVRGTRKEKVLYWLYICEGYFNVVVWFKEKNRNEVLKIDVSEETLQIIHRAKAEMGLSTFPVVIKVTKEELLPDVYSLIEVKKRLESN